MFISQEQNYTKSIKLNEIEKEKLGEELKQITEQYNALKLKLEVKVSKLETDNNYFENENNQMNREINEITPVYQKLCKDFADKTREHNDSRQLLISK